MAAHHYYQDPDDGFIEITDRVTTDGWAYAEAEEEGTTSRSTLAVPDQELDFEPIGHRPFRVIEDASESDDDILFSGFTWNNDTGRKQGDELELGARAITIQLDDNNAVWQRPVMVGSDCNRGEETDVERMEWLLATNELQIIDDATTYFHTGSPVDMDANDYRGQHADQIARDCAEQSGKNWWLKFIGGGDGRLLRAWYGRDSEDTYDSELFLTNDDAALIEEEMLDGTALTWPGQEWKVERDYSRTYCSIYAQWDGGASYVHSSAIHAAYFEDIGPDSHRTMTVPMPNVHTVTKAKARAARMLADLEDPDIHVSATVRLPAAKATMLRSGMRVPIKLTHEPEFDDWKWCRIVNAEVTSVAAGTQYDIAIEAVPTGPPDSDGPAPDDFAGTVFAGLQRTDYTHPNSTPIFDNCFNAGEQAPGNYIHDEEGPITVDQSTDPYSTITVSAPMTVRLWARGQGAGVYLVTEDVTLAITVNGSIVGHDSQNTGTGYQAWTREVDIHDYHLDAGDVVSVTGTNSAAWGAVGINETFLMVGRGTIVDEAGSFDTIMVGP